MRLEDVVKLARNTPTGVGKTVFVVGGRYIAVKHPHGRGEDLMYAMVWFVDIETPPRAWGRRASEAAAL